MSCFRSVNPYYGHLKLYLQYGSEGAGTSDKVREGEDRVRDGEDEAGKRKAETIKA